MGYKSDNLKKMFCWSSSHTKDILGAALKCRSAGTKQTESSLVEEALAAFLLPTNRQAKFIAEDMFVSNSLARAYESVFHLLEAGPNGVDAWASNGFPLVECFRDAVFINMARIRCDKASGDIKYIASKFDSIARYVNDHDPLTGQYMYDLIAEMENAPEYFSFFNIINSIIQSWSLIGTKSYTYRVLAAIVRLCPEWVSDNDINRTVFLDTLDLVSKEW